MTDKKVVVVEIASKPRRRTVGVAMLVFFRLCV